MVNARPLPDSTTPAKEIIRSLRTWPDADLARLAREVGYELIRRGQALPVALPVGEAVATIGGGVTV